jgi:hypothetical protein
MEETVMSYSVSDSPTDSVAHWIDTSLVSDPALLNLMASYNWAPFLGYELGSSSSLVQDAFATTTNQAATNNFGLANGFGNEYTISRKPSTVKSDATSESFSTLEQPSQVTERPTIDEVAKAKKEVSERWSWIHHSVYDGSDPLQFRNVARKTEKPNKPSGNARIQRLPGSKEKCRN